MTYASKYPSTLKDIPDNTAFIVLYNDSVTEHDYYGGSPSRRDLVKVMTFDTEELMKEYITSELQPTQWRSAKSPSDFKIIPYRPISLSVKTEFNFN